MPKGTGKGATTWNLGGLLPPDAPDMKAVSTQADSILLRLENKKQDLPGMGLDGVKSALEIHEGVYDLVLRAQSLAYLRFSADTADEKAKVSLDFAEEMRAGLENRILFFRLWWTGLPNERAEQLVPPSPDYRYFLASWRRMKPFLLDEKVEQAIMTKNTTGAAEWGKHYSMITSSFTYTLGAADRSTKKKGKPKAMVFAELSKLFSSPLPKVRQAAYDTLLSKYEENAKVIGDIYRTIVRDWRNENQKMRGFPKPISPRNLENDLTDETTETLLRSCRENAGVFREFFKTKAKLLGLRKLRRYDFSAPLVRKEKKIGYADSVKKVMAAFESFDEDFARTARRVFEAGHVDSSPRKGKESGAFCMSVVPSVVPFLLLNFSGRVRDTYTIAHELGHAVHSQLASAHSVLTFHPPLVLAETASVFAEMILFDKFMDEERDDDLKREVLAEKIADMYATVGRQAHFVMFEEEAHGAVEQGATVSELSARYKSNLESQFLDTVSLADAFRWEWTAIPHIYHTPFYCYAYSFGNLLSLALYDRYANEGKSFVPSYLRILSYGGSESPARILSSVGLDIESAAFWKSGFDVIERMVADLRKL